MLMHCYDLARPNPHVTLFVQSYTNAISYIASCQTSETLHSPTASYNLLSRVVERSEVLYHNIHSPHRTHAFWAGDLKMLLLSRPFLDLHMCDSKARLGTIQYK